MNRASASAPQGAFDEAERRARLRLIRSQNVGPVSFHALIRRYGNAARALEALPQLARSGGKRMLRLASDEDIDIELSQAEKFGAQCVLFGEPDYPALLAQIHSAPPILWAVGDIELLKRPSVALVGARNASIASSRFAYRLADEIGQAGYAITSGLARGIDTAAHKGSLQTGTIAVLAGGLDRLYPPENDELYRNISQSGLLLSEMPFGMAPRGVDFPRRNRIVAGLSLGLLVVEAALRSGSLISARLANEMGRLVFAVPGSPLDPRSEGANHLIKDGAILTTSSEDVIAALAPLDARVTTAEPAFHQPEEEAFLSEPEETDRQKVLSLLSHVTVTLDDIIQQSDLKPAKVMLILLELELAGRLRRTDNGALSLS